MRERYPNAGKHFNLVFRAVVFRSIVPAGGGKVVGRVRRTTIFLTNQSAG